MKNVENIDLSKITILEHGFEKLYNKPVKCNNLILMLCKSGEIDIEINYVTYTLKRNGFLSIAPYDIVVVKGGSSDFRSQALVLPVTLFTRIIAELKMSQ